MAGCFRRRFGARNASRCFDRDTTDDTGGGSLRAAVAAANANNAADTINFAIAGCPGGICTITLTGGALVVSSASTTGTLSITNATGASNLLISGNNASRVFRVSPGGNLTLNGLTVTVGNAFTGDGGGITNITGILTMDNSTVSGNLSSNIGGIYNFANATLNLTSVTVTQNCSTGTTCTSCSGGITTGGTANLRNTIVAGNTVADASAPPDFRGTVAAGSAYNLIGNNQGTTGIADGDAGQNQVGTPVNPIDPRLSPLGNYGGATQTHGLLLDSPAIDRGFSFGLITDERGFARPVDNTAIANAPGGDGADIGAYEIQFGPTAASVTISGRATTAAGRSIRSVLITLTDAHGNTRTAQTTAFGYYRFDDVAAGETVTLSVKARQFRFAQPTIVRTTNELISDANFVSEQ